MEKNENGWVIINIGHSRTASKVMYSYTFRLTKRQAIKDFIIGTSETWKCLRDKFNFRCVKAESIIKTKD